MKFETKVCLCAVICAFSFSSISRASRLIGHEGSPYDVGFLTFDQGTRTAFAASSNAVLGNTYALASARYDQDLLVPLAPQKARVNGIDDVTDPVYSARFLFFASLAGRPVGVLDMGVVTMGAGAKFDLAKNRIVCYTSFIDPAHIALVFSDPLKDAAAADSGDIVAFAATKIALASGTERMYALVKNHAEDPFGAPGSALIVARLGEQNTTIEQQGTIEITGSTALLKVGGTDVTFFNTVNPPSLWASVFPSVGVVYSGFILQSATGARAVIAGSKEIAPVAAIGADSIVGTNTATQVAILNVATVHGVTGVDYLLVNGGVNASVAAVENKLYALPLVNSPTSSAYGQLAKKDAEPTNGIISGAATAAGDLFSSTDAGVLVGGDNAPGGINKLFVYGDTVVIITQEGPVQQAGVFSSQPVYTASGRIAGWTSWERVAVPAGAETSCVIDQTNGAAWYAVGQGVYRNEWSKVSSAISTRFATVSSGVQGLADFPFSTPSFNQTASQRISALAAVGNNCCMLVQVGADNAGDKFGPTYGQTNFFVSKDGSLSGFPPTPTNTPAIEGLDISGGALETVGAMVTADVCADFAKTNGWFFVGGSGGCAVLARPDGTGWAYGNLAKGFVGLSADMRFVRFTDVTFVKKIMTDGTYVYLLTPTKLVRVLLNAAACASGMGAPYELVADATQVFSDPFSCFTDFVVDKYRVVIGMNSGLLVSTNGGGLWGSQQTFAWKFIELPFSAQAITRISVSSLAGAGPESRLQDSLLFVLDSYMGRDQARLYVLAVPSGETPQILRQGTWPYWYIWPSYRAWFERYDGINFAGRSGFSPVGVHPFLANAGRTTDAVGVVTFSGMYLSALERVSAHGSLIAADETGLYSCV